MTQSGYWNPNPYADPSAYGTSTAATSAAANAANAAEHGTKTVLDPDGGTSLAPSGADNWQLGSTFGAPLANASAVFAPQYGGYAGGYANTRNQLLGAQQGALTQAAPQANFSQAQGYLGAANAVNAQEQANLKGLGAQASQLQGIVGGGQTAADAALASGLKSGAEAQQSMAASAAPGASYSAAQRGSAGNQSYATAQGAQQHAQLDFSQQQAARSQLSQVQQAQAQALQSARGLQQGIVQGQQGIAEYNPGLQEQQNQINQGMASGYNTALLGVQGSAQQASLTADQNANAYTLGLAGQNVAQNQTNIGAATSAAGAGLGQLSGYLNSGSSGGSSSDPWANPANNNPTGGF